VLVWRWGRGGLRSGGLCVEVLGCGVRGALESGGACAEGGLADESAELLATRGHFGGAGRVVMRSLRDRATDCTAQEGRLCEECVRHFVGGGL
jgi:hypothetical protein